MRQEDKAAPPRDLTSLGWVGAQGPAEKNGSTAQPQRPAQAPWGVTDPRISPVHPPTPHSSPHLPVQRAARAQQSRGRSSRAGGPDIPAGRDGAQHRAHRDAPPEPRNGSPPASPKPRNGPGVPSPRQASVWFPLPGLGGGGVSPAGVSPAPLRGGRTGGSQPVHGAAAFGAAALYGAARGGGGRERRDSPGAALGPAPGPGSAAGSRPPPAPAPACPTSRLSPASHVPRATPPPPRSYVPRAVPHSPACAPLPHSGDSPPG